AAEHSAPVLRLTCACIEDTPGLRRADGLTVETDVDLRDAADHLAVVVDRRTARPCELLLDPNRPSLGDVRDNGHLRMAGQTGVRLRDHLLRIVQRVRDRV